MHPEILLFQTSRESCLSQYLGLYLLILLRWILGFFDCRFQLPDKFSSDPLFTVFFCSQLDCFSPIVGSALALFLRPALSAVAQVEMWCSNSTRALGFLTISAVSIGAVAMSIATLEDRSRTRAMECIASCDECKACISCRKSGNTSSDPAADCIAGRLAQEEYNLRLHPFLCIFITLIFLSVRNSNSWLRQRASEAAAFVGRRSLELYVLQYHIWLAADAKRILVVLPAWPAANAALLGLVFFVVAVAARSFTQAAMEATEKIAVSVAPWMARRGHAVV